MNKWDHLPNAKYIDAVIASVKAHPKEWHAVWSTATEATWITARDAAKNSVKDSARHAACLTAMYAAWNPSWVEAWNASWDAIRALVAWDDCAYMLESDPGELEIIAVLGCLKATLLLPACKALAAIKEKENA